MTYAAAAVVVLLAAAIVVGAVLIGRELARSNRRLTDQILAVCIEDRARAQQATASAPAEAAPAKPDPGRTVLRAPQRPTNGHAFAVEEADLLS